MIELALGILIGLLINPIKEKTAPILNKQLKRVLGKKAQIIDIDDPLDNINL